MSIPRNLSFLAEGASSTGVLGAANGGTGLTSPGTSGNVLTSNGTAWTSTPPAGGGVTSLTAGNGILVSASTGAVTVSQDIYTGSTATNTSYPVGTCLIAYDVDALCLPTYVAQARTVFVQNSSTNSQFGFKDLGGVPSGYTALTGTWRSRGQVNGTVNFMFQRTA